MARERLHSGEGKKRTGAWILANRQKKKERREDAGVEAKGRKESEGASVLHVSIQAGVRDLAKCVPRLILPWEGLGGTREGKGSSFQ